mmetsp:Transcript_14189/g.29599  ORF Transcript_14189/g.29599 Transcript_14189/m.29599 type:complete len:103 (-) Transcript_14189:263-571(-)
MYLEPNATQPKLWRIPQKFQIDIRSYGGGLVLYQAPIDRELPFFNMPVKVNERWWKPNSAFCTISANSLVLFDVIVHPNAPHMFQYGNNHNSTHTAYEVERF